MKILKGNAGSLTNFEVLNFLRSRGASKDPTRVLVPVAQSEFKAYDYLVESAACNQTRDNVIEFLEIIEQSGTRFEEEQLQELVDQVAKVLPPHPNRTNTEERTTEAEWVGEDQKETTDGGGIDVVDDETADGDMNQSKSRLL